MNRKYAYLCIGFSALILSYIGAGKHDYMAYLEQWDIIVEGMPPSIDTGNSYGVIFNLFAYINFIPNTYLPKAIFIYIYLIASYELWKFSILKKILSHNIILLVLFANPLFWIFSIKLGSNDAFLAGITILAIISFLKDKFYLSGLLFAIGIGFKFSPIFIIIFFASNRLKLNFKFVVSFIISISIIYICGYYLWGNSIFEPLILGTERLSKSLSIFRFIRGDIQPLGFLGISNLDKYSIYLVIFATIISTVLYLKYNLDRLLMALFTFSNLLLLYKVGHHQFYLLLLMLTLLVYIENENILKSNPLFVRSTIMFWIYFFIITILYNYTEYYGGNYSIIREYIGFPTFVIHLTWNVLILKLLYFKTNIKISRNLTLHSFRHTNT